MQNAFSAARYNRLPSVNEAYETLQAIDPALVGVERVLSIVRQHRRQAELGVFLLHRHFDCADGELMLERRMPAGSDVVYATGPVRSDGITNVSATRFAL